MKSSTRPLVSKRRRDTATVPGSVNKRARARQQAANKRPTQAARARQQAANKRPTQAARADRHVLYQASVQDTAADLHFINRVFKKERGRKPATLREDFCGTAKLCGDWVRRQPERSAIGLDLDAATLRWGHEHNIAPLGEAARRVQLMRGNVLDGTTQKSDVIVAFNFSYCVFKKRGDLLRYCKRARRDLTPEGVFMLDIHGGSECFVELEESKPVDGFTYVWDQEPFDAINGHGVRHIHFRFRDGSELKRAFTYDWRIWTLPEMRDILVDAGFSRVEVYWEGADEDGEGNGIFRRVTQAEDEESWIAYILAWK